MSSLNLTVMEKNDVQIFVENVQNAKPHDVDVFMSWFAKGNQAAWHRFIVGAYNHPITWWIGIFQLQMQMGIWGHHRRAVASTRSNVLWQATQPLRSEAGKMLQGKPAPLLSGIVKYNLKYRKADIAGRLVGGQFTNYASMGGRFGNKRLPKSVKLPVGAANFILASYGAAIKAVVEGHRNAEAVIQSILTGHPEHLPKNYRSDSNAPLTENETQLYQNIESALSEVMSLTQVTPGPVPIKEFCSRPENINLKGVCK